jgi:hypothetical protein
MVLRKNDRRPTITKRDAFAICTTLTRCAEKMPREVLLTALVEAGEAWRGPRARTAPWFYLKGNTVQFKTIKTNDP